MNDDRRFEDCFKQIREPKRKSWVLFSEGAEGRIAERMESFGIRVNTLAIDVDRYRRYFEAAGYSKRFPDYYSFNIFEKSLEHYIAATLLQLSSLDVYIDIASENSPVPEIYSELFGTRSYRQDIAYELGVHGDRIGGDAAQMPVPDGFGTKMALHCSFEHFEDDSDIGFIREVERVLSPGGAVCIVPLYLAEEYGIQTDPKVAFASAINFEEGTTVFCAKGWGNRHGRFYDPDHFASRVLKNLGTMKAHLYRITNATQVHASCYARFALLLRKPPVGSL